MIDKKKYPRTWTKEKWKYFHRQLRVGAALSTKYSSFHSKKSDELDIFRDFFSYGESHVFGELRNLLYERDYHSRGLKKVSHIITKTLEVKRKSVGLHKAVVTQDLNQGSF